MSAEDNALLNIVANAIGGDEFVPLSTRYVIASRVLDALRSNGFEVVELPEPIHRCPRDAAWMTKDEALQVDSDRRSGIALSYLDVDLPVYGPWSAVEARDLAASFLAAARHAEEGTP